MQKFLRVIKEVLDRPSTHLLVGIILVITSGTEVIEDFHQDVERFHLGSHHGMIVLGLAQFFTALPAAVEGLERWLKAKEIAESGSKE